MRKTCLVLLAALLMAIALGAAKAEKRVALVVGNSNYTKISSLKNAKADAELIAESLKDVGFEVVLATDVDRLEMARAIRKFGRRLRAAGNDAVGLFYFAGHGVQAGGTNYLIPLGTLVEDDADLDVEAVSAAYVLKQMKSAGNALNLLVLDACRNNPYRSATRSTTRGLARIVAASGALVSFSAAPGEVAYDGDGSNSPFTAALADTIKQPGLAVEHVFKTVRVRVEQETGGKQTPWEESSLLGDFYFTPANAAKPAQTPVANVERTEPKPSLQSADRSAWIAIQGTQSKAVLKAFIKQFPDSIYANFARARLGELEGQSAAADPAPVPKDVTVSEATQSNQQQVEENSSLSQEPNPVPVETTEHETAKPEQSHENDAPDQVAMVPPESVMETEPDPDLSRKLQIALRDAGCNPGAIDGKWGRKSEAALKRFARYANMPQPDNAVSEETLKLLKRRDGRVCPSICGPNQIEQNGRCVARLCPSGQTLTSSGNCVKSARRTPKPIVVDGNRKANPKRAVPTRVRNCDDNFAHTEC